jgi:CheY-like chemotaxis protein
MAMCDAGAVAAPQPERLRVLVADSYPDAADSLAQLVRLWGHDVRVARTGLEAWDVAGEFRPDVAICELTLAGLDGVALAVRLKGEQGLRGVKLVAVTAQGDPATRHRAFEAGFTLQFLKPVDPEVLRLLLAALRERRDA